MFLEFFLFIFFVDFEVEVIFRKGRDQKDSQFLILKLFGKAIVSLLKNSFSVFIDLSIYRYVSDCCVHFMQIRR